MFSKLLVANRSEIAVRVLRTCRELGITGVAVHSDPDSEALHVRVADEAVRLAGTSPAETYLAIDKVVQAALDTGAEAIHPGYGFLAENADFAHAVEAAGLVFVGPPAAAIDVMGEKVAARAVAAAADVPQVPGSAGAVTTVQEVLDFGATHGYPIAIKASYGGGGRGMRTVAGPDDVAGALEAAQREAGAAFGRSEVYLERYLSDARHVEVQLMADQHGNVVWLGDRDCSVQRRHQKLVEESPAPGLSDTLRTAMGEASVRLAREVDYVGAGTVEFLVEADRDAFYFLEMNTRIQVEHPVTEQVLGLDLVAEQIRVAAGEPLSTKASGPEPRGHAIEVRINAEDVAGGAFHPAPGRIEQLAVPVRTGVRLDSGYESGDEVLPYYDSMIGKLVVWAPTREHCLRRAVQTLQETVVRGVPTTIPAALLVLDHPDFRAARISTRWLETSVDLAGALPTTDFSGSSAAGGDDDSDDETDGAGDVRQEVWVAGRRYVVPWHGDHAGTPGAAATSGPSAQPTDVGRRRASSGTNRGARSGPRGVAGHGTHTSPMQGTVISVNVSPGQPVTKGDVLMVIEAMKMENPVRATVDGTVQSLSAEVGQVVAAGFVLAVVEPGAQ
jgi:acetyl-CoA/propionyl-CoA carboxylase biotin carboxyl carrier protein